MTNGAMQVSDASKPRYYNVEGIVLRVQPYLEKDRILVLFTRELGKTSAIAKGSRLPKSKLAAGTQLFSHGRYFLAWGKTLDIVTQIRLRENFYTIRQDLPLMTRCCMASELLLKTLPDRQPDSALFDEWLCFLRIAEHGVDPELFLCAFESKLLLRLGHFPELAVCVGCGGEVTEPVMDFSFEVGGVLCRRCSTRRVAGMRISRLTALALKSMAYQQPFALRRLNLSKEIKGEAMRLLERFVKHHFDVELKSKTILEIGDWRAVNTGGEL